MQTNLRQLPTPNSEIISNEFSPQALSFLNRLRLMAMQCRSSAHVDIFEACKLLVRSDDCLSDHFVESLVRTMRQGLDRSPKFYSPSTLEQSFDEKWLLRALFRAQDNDWASVKFLLNSRISLPYRRSMMFLIKNVSEQISRI